MEFHERLILDIFYFKYGNVYVAKLNFYIFYTYSLKLRPIHRYGVRKCFYAFNLSVNCFLCKGAPACKIGSRKLFSTQLPVFPTILQKLLERCGGYQINHVETNFEEA